MRLYCCSRHPSKPPGGDDTTKAKAFIMVASGIARTWYTTLAPRSILWDQLRDLLISEFQGNQARAVTSGDLHICVQTPNETLREYFQRFNNLRHQERGISQEMIVSAATNGLQEGALRSKLNRKRPTRVSELMRFFEEFASMEDDRLHERNKARIREEEMRKRDQ